jgi:hypothetical protein
VVGKQRAIDFGVLSPKCDGVRVEASMESAFAGEEGPVAEAIGLLPPTRTHGRVGGMEAEVV